MSRSIHADLSMTIYLRQVIAMCLLVSPILFLANKAIAEPTVIYDDVSQSFDISKYHRIFTRTEAIRSASRRAINALAPNDLKIDLIADPIISPIDKTTSAITQKKGWLPIHTPELSFGVVKTRDAYFPNVPRPLCVIGADNNSMLWLDQNLAALIKMHAYCWLVEAKDHADIKRVAQHAKGLQVVPAQGSVLNQLFGIRHYPLLITGRELIQ